MMNRSSVSGEATRTSNNNISSGTPPTSDALEHHQVPPSALNEHGRVTPFDEICDGPLYPATATDGIGLPSSSSSSSSSADDAGHVGVMLVGDGGGSGGYLHDGGGGLAASSLSIPSLLPFLQPTQQPIVAVVDSEDIGSPVGLPPAPVAFFRAPPTELPIDSDASALADDDDLEFAEGLQLQEEDPSDLQQPHSQHQCNNCREDGFNCPLCDPHGATIGAMAISVEIEPQHLINSVSHSTASTPRHLAEPKGSTTVSHASLDDPKLELSTFSAYEVENGSMSVHSSSTTSTLASTSFNTCSSTRVLLPAAAVVEHTSS